MTPRDELIQRVQGEIARTGLTDTAEKVYRILLLTTLRKMLITGKSSYDMFLWLNKQSNICGRDMVPVVKEVYEVIKDVEL